MSKDFLLAELKVHPDRGPVTMLNLVKFRPYSLDGNGTGADAYHRYLAAAGAEAERRGCLLVWGADVSQAALHHGGDADWDWALIVHYPSRDAFTDFVTCPAYLEANVHRENGVAKHMILATKTAPGFDKLLAGIGGGAAR